MPWMALESFAAPDMRRIGRGQIVEDDDPVVVGREVLFRRIRFEDGPVEQATAAPGERRMTGRRPSV